MLFSESIKTALDSIKSNATRSFLTALAIIIGIASVIAMLSIGAGAQQALEDEITWPTSTGLEIIVASSGDLTNVSSNAIFAFSTLTIDLTC